MGVVAWFSLFKFSWLRRCKTCGIRGSKCLCRRPSLALEHIFFLEERKNRFGARNFSHVSDTMMTSHSTMCYNNADVPSNSTVAMRSDGSILDTEVNPTDYYDQTSTLHSTASECNCVLLTPRMDNNMDKHRSQNHGRDYKISSSSDLSTMTLVPTASGRVVSKARHNGDTNLQPPPIKEIVTGEFIRHAESNHPISLPYRQHKTQKHIVLRGRQYSRQESKTPIMSNTRPQYKEEPGVSFQFFGRNGSVAPDAIVSTLVSSSRSNHRRSSCSTNDSFVMGSSLVATTRPSQYSDRVSLETNFGSLNPQQNLGTAGRLIEHGYAPSIQEDEEAHALEQLTGWLHASSISTQDSFMLSR